MNGKKKTLEIYSSSKNNIFIELCTGDQQKA